MRTSDAVIRADVKYEGTWYLYTDCLGREIRSSVELSCPVFAGEGVSAGLEGKELGRRAQIAADKVDLRVTQLDARVMQLEADNAALREQIGAVTQIDVRQLAAALLELAQKAKASKVLESIEVRGQQVLVPKELVEVIDVVAVREVDPVGVDPVGVDPVGVDP
jgi:hypothetical protein